MRHISSAPGCLGHRRADSRIAGTCIPPATGIVTNTHDMRRQSRTEVETGAKSGGRARRSYLPNTTYSGLVKQPDKQELASFWRETRSASKNDGLVSAADSNFGRSSDRHGSFFISLEGKTALDGQFAYSLRSTEDTSRMALRSFRGAAWLTPLFFDVFPFGLTAGQ